MLKKDKVLLKYLPDEPELPADSMDTGASIVYRCDKKFFWVVLHTLRPDWTNKLIRESVRQRNEHALANAKKENNIQILPTFVPGLMECAIIDSKYILLRLIFIIRV